MASLDFPFNLRVYGLWVTDQQQVLVVDEQYGDLRFTKFPGGGLEFGESTRECLKRECREEMNTKVTVLDHFYTTDVFQASAFNSGHQLISIYYFMRPTTHLGINLAHQPFGDAKPTDRGPVAFRLVSLQEVSPKLFHFPIDQLVAQRIALGN